MHRIQFLTNGVVTKETLCLTSRRASLTYCRQLLRLQRRGGHIRWIEGDALPGLPPKVIAEWFGEAAPPPQAEPIIAPLWGGKE